MRSLNLMLAMSTAIAAVGTAQSADTAVAATVTPVEAAPIVLSNVEYVSGKDGLIEKLKGELVIMPGSISFTQKGKDIFTIKMATVTDVSRQTDVRDGSVGKKLLFGALAGSRKQEFLNLTSETDNSAEGLMFKVPQGSSQSAVAKIRFYARRARAAAGLPAPSGDSQSGGSIVAQ